MTLKAGGGGGGKLCMNEATPRVVVAGNSSGLISNTRQWGANPRIKLKILDSRIANSLPEYQTAGSAAMDLRVCQWTGFKWALEPDESILVGTGIALHIEDPNVAAMLLPRSGLGHAKGIVLGNLLGLLDSDYQNEVKISVWNRSKEYFVIKEGDRICQIMFIPVLRPTFEIVEEFENTERGAGGFGSTGIS